MRERAGLGSLGACGLRCGQSIRKAARLGSAVRKGKMPGERSVKHAILRSFETLIKGMDPRAEAQEPQERQEKQKQQRPVKPRTVVATGEFLGRKWRVYSDGAFEGETVRGMEAFRDLDHFKSFVE